MEKKLTLVSIGCGRKVVTTFIKLPYINGRAILYNSTIDKLFMHYWGFTPQRGETITFY